VLAATPDEALQFATDEQLGALPFVPSWSAREKVAVELEVLGLNVSAHPLDFVRAELTALDAVPFGRLHLVPNGRRIRLAGVLERAQMPWIRSGHRTLFLTLEDESGLAEVVVFNDVYLRYGRVLKEGSTCSSRASCKTTTNVAWRSSPRASSTSRRCSASCATCRRRPQPCPQALRRVAAQSRAAHAAGAHRVTLAQR